MNAEQVVLLLGGMSAFVAALVAAYRSLTGDRFNRKVSESAALLTGYTEMIKNVRLELADVRRDNDLEVTRNKRMAVEDLARLERLHKQEIDGLIAVYTAERKNWEEQRARMEQQFGRDRARWDTDRLELKERLAGLESQVYVIRNNPRENQA